MNLLIKLLQILKSIHVLRKCIMEANKGEFTLIGIGHKTNVSFN